MRAAFITEPGPPEAIRVGELPVPTAGPSDVLVQGVDVYWDTSGRVQLASVPPVMTAGGRILVTAGREPQADFPWWAFYTRALTVAGFVISLATAELAETARAHALVEPGEARGRVVTMST